MSANPYTPALRLEIRNKTEDGKAPWFVFDTALTDNQAQDKLRRHKIADDCEARAMPNDALGTPPAPVMVDSEETKILIAQVQTENLALRRENNSLTGKVSAMTHEKIKATAPLDALAGETPLPFAPGDLLRDVHTGVAVKVIEINPPHPRTGNKRPGFSWENTTTKPGDKDHTGYCPLASVGCFVKPGEKLEEKAAPVEKPAAAPSVALANDPAAAPSAPAPLISGARVNPTPHAARPPKARPSTPPKKTNPFAKKTAPAKKSKK